MASKHVRTVLSAALSAAMLLAAPTLVQAQSTKRAAALEAPIPGVVTVSDYEFNTFVFPDTIKRVLFPAGSPVVGKPVYMAENTQVMLQFAKSAEKNPKPIQMVVELEGGAVVSVRVLPRAVPGVTHAVNGARPRSAAAAAARRAMTAEGQQSVTPRGEDIELLKKVVTSGDAPDGFEPVRLPRPTRFDKFTVVPLAGWTDGVSKRVLVFSLVAAPGQTAVVSPQQFYRPGINAVMLDGDVVDSANSPQLFVVEEMRDE